MQVVRHMHPHGGVGGVAHALEAIFAAEGVSGGAITVESLAGRARPAAAGRLGRLSEVVAFTVQGSLAARRARRRGAVVVVHGDALGGDVYVDHGLHKALLRRRPWLLAHPLHLFIWVREELRHALRAYGRLACLSAGGEAALQRAYPALRDGAGPWARLTNGVDLARFHPDASRMASPITLGDLRLAFVGHEFARKGLRHVIDALAELPHGVRLEVVGDGDLAWARRYVRRRGVADRTTILGRRQDVAAILRRSDLLVLPSSEEAWPLVTLEAMASGVPVLLSDIAAAHEILGDREGGRLVGRSGASIAAAVRALAADPDGFARLRRSAFARAQGFAWPEVARAYLALAAEVRSARMRVA